jgi:ketol-acid reductoisomerase
MGAGIYTHSSGSLATLSGLTVAVIGYGVQGRAFAANLRDSGVALVVGNIEDEYRERARADGFHPLAIAEAAEAADILILLIPDEAHRHVFESDLRPHHKPGALLILAHGYSLVCGDIPPLSTLDLALLAPRMYGDPIRQSFIEGRGAPAYLDVVHDASGRALERTLAIAKAMGFTRAGVMRLDFRQETVPDLFQEQFIAPALVEVIERGFEVLVRSGFDARAALLETYASGEIGQMLLDGAKAGLHEVIESQGSPTCQVGFHRHFGKLLGDDTEAKARSILSSIQSGEFAGFLQAQARAGYALLAERRRANQGRLITEVHRQVAATFPRSDEQSHSIYAPHAVGT